LSIINLIIVKSKFQNGLESIGLTIELNSLHSITQGAEISWNSEDHSLQLNGKNYTNINLEKDYEKWEEQFVDRNIDLAQIKKEIILNNFEERISENKPIFTVKWAEGKGYEYYYSY